MAKIIRIILLLMLSILVLLSASSCAQTLSEEEYDRVINELTETENQVAELQQKLEEAKSTEDTYEELIIKYEALEKERDTKLNEILIMEAEYKELNKQFEDLERENDNKASIIETIKAQYDELQNRYDAISEQVVEEITEEDIEQTLFELINQERTDNGEDELLWRDTLFKIAERNNRHMAESGMYEYDQAAAIQEIFWAINYDTVDAIVNAALVAWKNNPYRFERYLLSQATTHGAVDAHISGEIIYITYIATYYP